MGWLNRARCLTVITLALFAGGGLTGCQNSRAPRPENPWQAPQGRLTPDRAVRASLSADGTKLGVRFALKGKDAFAIATPGAGLTASLEFKQNAASLNSSLGKGTRIIPVFGPEVWRATADALALRVAPDAPGSGTLIMAGDRELIAHRLNGKGKLTPLSQRPARLRITRRITAAMLAREVFTERGDALDHPGGHDGPVLMLTGTFPEMVFLDHNARRLAFLTIPAEEATGLPLGKGGHAARQLTSFVWRSNILAALKNPISTCARLIASGASITNAGISRMITPLPLTPPPPLTKAPPMDLEAWEKELATMVSSPAGAATLRIRIGGDEFFPDFIQATQNARRKVDVQLYIFDNDDYAVSLADLLRLKSREGIKVRVLMDDSGSISAAAKPPESPMPAGFVPPPNIADYLRSDSKVQARVMPMTGFSASHTKIITVDGEIAWLGGMNFGREYRYDWHDLMLEVKGPLVQLIQEDFARAWAKHSWGGDFALIRQHLAEAGQPAVEIPAPAGAISVQPLYTSSRKREILRSQLAALNRCRSIAWIQNAYLSDGAYLNAMVRARHRGVDVRLILPADNDNGIMAANNRALVPLLRRHGIRVYLLPGMSHVKAALYDGWACVGSANFDRLSLRVNNEFSIGTSDPGFTTELKRRLFETDFRRSREVNGQPDSAPTDDVMNALIRSLAGQL